MQDFVEKQKFDEANTLTQADKNCTDNIKALVVDVVAGDQAAFAQLMNQYYDDIYRFSFHLTGNKTQAEDLTHDVCLKIASTIQQFKFNSQFISWVYRIVINIHKDNYKKQRNRLKRETDYHQQTSDNQAFRRPEEQIEYDELLGAIDQLPGKLKLTLILVQAQDLTHAQTAEILTCSTNTVSWRIHEARKQLKQILKEQS